MAQTTSSIFDNTVIAYNAWSSKDLKRTYWLFKLFDFTRMIGIKPKFYSGLVKLGVPLKGIFKKYVFKQFCGGEDLNSCGKLINKLGIFRVFTALDFAAENETEEQGFDSNVNEFIKIIRDGKGNRNLKYCVVKMTGIADAQLLQKNQQSGLTTSREKEEMQKIRDRLEKICREAYDHDLQVMIDGEESWIQGSISELGYEMMAKFNKEKAVIFNTYQMYLKKMDAQIKNAFRIATMKNFYLGIKLVRGAYMEKERKRAKKLGYTDPVHPDKDATDAAFNKAMAYCLNHKQRIYLCAGTHNEFSNHYLTVIIEKHGLKPNDPRVTFMQLYGMADHITFNLANRGYNVGKYVPYGPIEKVLPYLLRRVEENQSILANTRREQDLIKNELARRKQLDK